MNWGELIEWKISAGTILAMALNLCVVVGFGLKLTAIGADIRAKVTTMWDDWRSTEQRESVPVRLTALEHHVTDINNARRLGDWRTKGNNNDG